MSAISTASTRLPLIDAHCHYQDEWFAPHREKVFSDLVSENILQAVVNGTSETDWPAVATLCASAPAPLRLLPSYGLHPWDVGNRTPAWERLLREHLDATPGACLGEIGLDRWILDSARPDDRRLAGLRRAPIEEQTEVFVAQLTLAAERNLPTSIHCLEAFGPLYDALKASRLPARGFLLHAYNGSTQMAKSFADLGAHFSFNGAFLDPRKERLHNLYKMLPADRVLVETDAPAMRLPPAKEKYAPLTTPDGAIANHPANLATTYAALAQLRGISVEGLAIQVQENFNRLFSRGAS
jgi:TatD DNase family protein